MWASAIPLAGIINEGRWKVELFAGTDAPAKKTSTLPFVALGDLFFESRATLNPQEDPDNVFIFIGMENVESNTGDLTGNLSKKGVEIKSRSKTFSEGQIIYGRLRPTLNKVYLCSSDTPNGICSGEFIVLNVREGLVRPRVLREILSSEFVLEQVIRFIAGAALPRVSFSDLASIEVPLPSVETQMKLEKSLFDLDARRKKLKKELSEIPKIFSKILLEAQKLS